MNAGGGAVIIGDVRGERAPPRAGEVTHSVMVRVEDAEAHFERARAFGARIRRQPTDFEYGERQYSAEDPAGHQWTFSGPAPTSTPTSGVGSWSITASRRAFALPVAQTRSAKAMIASVI